MAVKIDIKPGSQISQDKNGVRAVRTALISGVTGNSDAVLNNALNDASMPAIGDAHPVITGITLQSIQITPAGGTQYKAALNYFDDPASDSGAANASIRANASTITEERKTDITGARMEAQWNGVAALYYKNYTAEVEVVKQRFDFNWRSASYPRALIDYLTGKINDASWNGYAAKTLLCTSISANESGTDFAVTASFVYEPEQWIFNGTADTASVLKHTGTADTGLDHSTGLKPFDVYETADYSVTGITIDGPYVDVTGTATTTQVLDTDIVAGGKTIILTLTDDTWVAAGATFDAERQAILDGLVSGKNEAAGWNAQNFAVGDVVRTSSTVVTITLSAEVSYTITETETITTTVPASALVTSGVPLLASQRFTIIDQSWFDGDGA